MPQLLFIGDDLHGPPAQNERGTYQHRITNFSGGLDAVLNLGDSLAFCTGDVQLIQKIFKCVAVFRLVNGSTVRADDLHAPVMERLCQIDCSLAAQGCNHTHGLFKLDDVHHIFGSQGLKVQLVRCGIVSGDGLRVVVDDDCLITGLFDGHDGMDGGIVKFHALTDADGSCTQHDDLLFVCKNGSILAAVRGIEIGDIGIGVAGIHHAEHGEQVVCLTKIVYINFLAFPKSGHVLVAEAHLLGSSQHSKVIDMDFQIFLHIHDTLDGF